MYRYFVMDSPFCSRKEIWGFLVAVFLFTCLMGCQSKEERIQQVFEAKNSKTTVEYREYLDAMKLLTMARTDKDSAYKKAIDAENKGENNKNFLQQYWLAEAYCRKIELDVTSKRGNALTELHKTKLYGEQNKTILRKAMKDYDVIMYVISKNLLQLEEDAREQK